MTHPRKIISIITSKKIREARLSGLTWEQLARRFDVSVSTAMRHGDPEHMLKQSRYQSDKYRRDGEKIRARQRAYRAAVRQTENHDEPR